MKLTIAHAHRLNRAVAAIARGFGPDPAKPANVIKTVPAKLAIARNMKRLHAVLEPVEELMNKERDKLLAEEREENPEAKELSPKRVQAITRFVQELNQQPCEVEINQISAGDLDLDKFEGEEALMALAVIDGDLLKAEGSDNGAPKLVHTEVVT